MPDRLRPRPGPILAGVLLALGLLSLAVFRIATGSESHSYDAGAVAPTTVTVTMGDTYGISTRGGISGLAKSGADVTPAACTWSTDSVSASMLAVTVLGLDDKSTHLVGTFSAPITGPIHIDCAGWGAIFVDDADHRPSDPAGFFLVLAIIALTLGCALGLSALYRASGAIER